ncbi:MAG: hypothetical protein HDQ98_12750 [Lachnospiraceae bacterium]|nr:hypothetical protein [Lachnospiraceae bacterium]
MDSIIKNILEIATGKKAKIFWAVILTIIVLLLLLYPYIDANFLIFSRINKRIDILERITQLDTDKINSNLALQDEYNSIIEEISAIQDKSVGLITTRQDTTNEKTIKFISGGILLWFVSLFVLFQKNKRESASIFKRIINNLVATALCVALGYLLALVGRSIPTIINVWINAIAFPGIQIAIIALIVYGSSNNHKKE